MRVLGPSWGRASQLTAAAAAAATARGGPAQAEAEQQLLDEIEFEWLWQFYAQARETCPALSWPALPTPNDPRAEASAHLIPGLSARAGCF